MSGKAPARMLQRRIVAELVGGIWMGTFLAGTAAAGDGLTIEVSAGDHDRTEVPLELVLPAGFARHESVSLQRLDGGVAVPVQFLRNGSDVRVAWILGDTLAAGQTRRFRLSPTTKTPPATPAVRVDDDGTGLVVKAGKRPVLRYNHAVVPSPNPEEPYYARSGYLHPIYNPAGQVVTDDFSPDHPHQHGLMFPWTNCTFEGRKVNFWDQKQGSARVEHWKIEAQDGGPVFGFFTARIRHLDLSAPGTPRPVLDETWRVRVYNLTDFFLFDLESTQRCASESPLVVQKYHYGGLAIRGHRDWIPSAGDFLTSEGKTRANGNHSRPKWCDIHGTVQGRQTGVTILAHPTNFRFPQAVRLHPQMPYFCFAPMVQGRFTIAPGEPYTSRHRFYVHVGDVDPAEADRRWRDYAQPPQVRLIGGP